MLQNASYMFFQKETKQNKTTTKKRKKSHLRDLRRVRAKHYPLRHATTAKTVRQINCIFNMINYSRWRRKCRRTAKSVQQKVTLEYHRSPKIMCCVLLRSNAIKNEGEKILRNIQQVAKLLALSPVFSLRKNKAFI